MTETQPPRLSRPLVDHETIAWLALVAVAAVARLWRLGERVMSHDESLHAYYSWVLATTGKYEHVPSLHGPLLYHVDALVFLLFGASDAWARLLAALAGVGAVALLRAFRPWMGSGGALAAAAMVVISPTHLFYSRYIRNDALIVLFSLLWVLAMLRYLQDRRARWLALMTLAMALSFSCKEVAFIQGWIYGVFALALALRRSLAPEVRSAAGDLAVAMITLVLPFAAGAWHVVAGWPVADDGSVLALRRGLLTASALALGAVILAAAWFRRGRGSGGGPGLRVWSLCAIAFWTFLLLLFTGLGARPRGGFLSGVVGSLGYWLGQHEVNRGSQPWFYYLLLGALYELAPAALAMLGAVFLWRRRTAPPTADWPFRDQSAPSVTAPGHRTLFLELCLWWTVGAWVAYSLAGERMPWLLLHPMLPVHLLAGWFLALLFADLPARWRERPRLRSLAIVGALVPVAVIGATALPAPDDAAAQLRWALRAGMALALVLLASRGLRTRAGARWLLSGMALLGLLWTVRVAAQASFVRYDEATEPLVYAHGAPDVKAAMRELEMISLRTVGERQLAIAFHPEVSWPFAWYLRDFPNARLFTKPEELAGSGATVVLAAMPAPEWLWSHVARDFVPRNYRMIWWPLQEYAGRTPRELLRWLVEPARRESLRQVFLFRRYPGLTLAAWPQRKDIRMYVRRDLEPLGGQLPLALAGVPPRPFGGTPVQEMEWVPERVLAMAGRRGPLSRPTALAALREGGWAIADSGNHRVVLLSADGSLLGEIDNRPARPEPSQGEVWGLAVGPGGDLAVADTWRGRIRLFDASGRPLATWGRYGTADGDRPADPALYGPRGIVFSPAGEILVADTGNRRLLRYSAEGRPLGEVGMGAASTRFDEPVGLAFAADGSLLVADTWNRRIVRLGDRLEPLDHWPVPGWESRDARDKPYLAVDAAGRVYATAPAAGRVFVYSPDGELLAGLRYPGGLGSVRPIGIAYQALGDRIAVADWDGGRVLVMAPLAGG